MGGLQTNISKGRIQTHKGTFEEKSGAAFNHVFLYEDPLQVVQPSYVEVGMSLLLDGRKGELNYVQRLQPQW